MLLPAIIAILLALLNFRFYWLQRDRASLWLCLGWSLTALAFFLNIRPLLIPGIALVLFGIIQRLLKKGAQP